MRKTEEEQGAKLVRIMSCVLLGGATAVVLCVMFLLVCSVGISMGAVPEDRMYQLTVAGCVFGSLLGGATAVRRYGTAPLPIGIASGAIAFFLFLTAGLLLFEADLGERGGLGLLLGCLCGGAVSGLFGGRKKKRHRKK